MRCGTAVARLPGTRRGSVQTLRGPARLNRPGCRITILQKYQAAYRLTIPGSWLKYLWPKSPFAFFI
jgi:hypothetical protein